MIFKNDKSYRLEILIVYAQNKVLILSQQV